MAEIVKLREPEARILVLRIAADFPNHAASTSDIKAAAPKYREMGEKDLLPSKVRKGECMWQQIIGNALASHQETRVSIFARGLAVKTRNGIQLTEKGLQYVKNQPK